MKIAKISVSSSILLISFVTSLVAYAGQETNCNGGRFRQSACGSGSRVNIYNIPRDSPKAPFWKPNKHYDVGDVVVFKGRKYQCRIAHDSYDISWTPLGAPSLWMGI
ncbi:carbohydrate-binding protein [Nostoc sp.]|uniref:carbohydrate-binding protein n=1 Tax=Nostoc sp. TaxID=1180 RepID=UPI003FA5AD37